ncbi:Nramp family divalent metal transporter [Petropleomorpha daqingensis]|uniref:Divalent metal cation transporter MntH n=1 Tax=Petropleomorpha daqingensis TaxID=2026353 RepID=A0A853CD56_9ACTN|nr:Nramp family divalent metal transporter [Petropleomorpha daqingensis]NYJ05704.1 manganese transport protein [Petropleomorpha daqingensis]
MTVLEKDAAVRATRRRRLALFGPAFVAAIAYVDPGNFATNVSAGARFGYLLLWVIVSANLMAMLVQSLSAKLGLATGMSLPQNCRARYRRPVVLGLWVQAEVVAMATDLAEVMGGAIALHLLFGVDLFTGGVITGAVAFGLLALQTRGDRRWIGAVTALFTVILVAFLLLIVRVPIDPAGAVAGLVPRFDGVASLVLATGILGATVMPHAIYLHSALVSTSIPAGTVNQRRRALRAQRGDVFAAMSLAGLVNVSMLLVAAALFAGSAFGGTDSLEGAHAGFGAALDGSAALLFALALLASGFASTSVGTYAGQVIMDGFLQRRIPLFTRRALTLVPALAILALGVDPTYALVVSQVVLSFGIPFALVPLVLLTRRPDVMGELVNRRRTTVAAVAVAAVIIALNAVLLVLLFS